MKTKDQETSEAPAGQGGSVRVFGEVLTCKVTSERTGGAFTLSEAIVPPGRGVPPHIHHREDEYFYVVAGEFEFTVEGRNDRAGAGSLIDVAKGTLHAYANVGEDSGQMLICQTPGGLSERFVEETRQLLSATAAPNFAGDSPLAAGFVAAAARYGIEIVPCEKPHLNDEGDK